MEMEISDEAKNGIENISHECQRIRPLVVISCITYNHEVFIRDALNGFVMQQTSFPFVAIVHDDASSDGTRKIIEEYAEKYPDIILPIFEKENQYSRQKGLVSLIMQKARDASCAKYIAMCEGDDYWTDPLKLQKQVDALEKHPECTIALHRVQTVDRNRKELSWKIPVSEDFKDGKVSLEELLNHEFRQGFWTFHTSSFLLHKEIYSRLNEINSAFFNKFPYGDMPILLTCLLSGPGYYTSDIMSHYTVLSGGYNSSLKADKELAAAQFMKVSEALYLFNKYTKLKYKKYLNIGALRYEYKAIAVREDFSIKMFHPKFHQFYSDAIFRFVKYRLPRMLSLYRSMKSNLKTK